MTNELRRSGFKAPRLRATAVKTATKDGWGGSKSRGPTVAVHAQDDEAEQLVLLARHFGVPVVVDQPLASRLACFEIGHRLPQDLLLLLTRALRALQRALSNQGIG